MVLSDPHTPPNRRPAEPPRPGTGRRGALRVVLVALAAATAAGCQSLSATNPIAVWRAGRDSALSKAPTTAETGDERKFMARWFTPKAPPPANVNGSNMVLGSDGWRPMKTEKDPAGETEFAAAESLFQQGQFAQAESAFAALAKNRKGTQYGEKGQYYLAETQFQLGKYVNAHDSYDLLMKDYQGTDFVEKVIKREYELAQIWLGQSDPKTPADKKFSWTAHFDGRAPLLDTRGHGLRALEHVRQHNPTGELADDAVLRIADEHLAMGDYESAGIYYDQLIVDHPKSPYLQRAQLAAIDARMKGYVGPEYDGAGLEKARDMVKQTMASFPDRQAGAETLYHTLDLINDQDAERTYSVGDYYRRAGYPASAEYYFAKIPQRWPKSPWAPKARTQLASLAKVPRKRHDPSKIMSLPGSTDPLLGGQGGMGGMGMGGMGMGGMGGMNGMN